LPTSGLPFQFHQWSDYERVVGDLHTVGIVDDVTEIRWDVRPVPRFGTVEHRVCDGVSTLQQVGAITALTQCLVHEVVGGDVDAMEHVDILQPWYVQENKWRAARYGLETIAIIDSDGTEMLVTDHLEQVLNRIEPIAQHLGCTKELQWVEDMMRANNSATHQRAQTHSKFGDKLSQEQLTSVVLGSAAETVDSIRTW
jgi:carboxylate-amine ligase